MTPQSALGGSGGMDRVDRVAPWLLIGPALPVAEVAELMLHGVRRVVDLRAEASDDSEALESLGIEWHRVPIPDGEPPTADQLDLITEWVPTVVGSATYVHCQAGLGRSPTVAIALLMSRGYRHRDAHRLVVAARSGVLLTERQAVWLQRLETSRRVSK